MVCTGCKHHIFFTSRRRHTRWPRDWSSDVCSSDLDETNLFAQQMYDVYHSFPESDSIFQITSPTGGFGGMVTKPWSQRKKTAQQLLVEASGPLSQIPGIRVIPLTPPPLPGGGSFPV